jgi:hypothetical protein
MGMKLERRKRGIAERIKPTTKSLLPIVFRK